MGEKTEVEGEGRGGETPPTRDSVETAFDVDSSFYGRWGVQDRFDGRKGGEKHGGAGGILKYSERGQIYGVENLQKKWRSKRWIK